MWVCKYNQTQSLLICLQRFIRQEEWELQSETMKARMTLASFAEDKKA